jgi:hypothetical protein
MGIDNANMTFMMDKAMKDLTQDVRKMNRDRPKLYGLIRQDMSVQTRDVVAQEPD